MRGLKMVAMAVALTAAAVGCGGGGSSDDDSAAPATTAAPTTTAAVPTSAAGTTLPATELTLKITDVRLANSEESDNAVRVLLPAGVASASVTMSNLPSPNRAISVCQTQDLDRKMSTAACKTPASGEAVNVVLGSTASGVEIVQAGVTGSGAAGNTTSIDEITIRYTAGSRQVNVRLGQIASGDSGGRPTFTLTPRGASGTYRAALTWTVIQVFGGTPSNARVELVQGGTSMNQAEGGGLDVRLEGTAAAGDAGIRVSNIGSSAMVSPKVSLLLP